MNLEEATLVILRSVKIWIEVNQHRPDWLLSNFDSFVLHKFRLIRTCPEYNQYWKLNFLRSRNLCHDFSGRAFSHLSFANLVTSCTYSEETDRKIDHYIKLLNEKIKEVLSDHDFEEDPIYTGMRDHALKSVKDIEFSSRMSSDKLIDLSKIKDFKF